MLSKFLKVKAGSCNKVFHHSRNKNASATSKLCHACGYVHGDTADVIVCHFNLTSMNANTNFDTKLRNSIPNSLGAADCTPRAIKRRQKAITKRLDFAPPKLPELLPQKTRSGPDQRVQ